MDDDPIKAAEARGYSKGYAAGKCRVGREEAQEVARGRRERFRQDVFLAMLPNLLGKGWGNTIGGKHKPWSSIKEYVDGAWKFSDQACKGTDFK